MAGSALGESAIADDTSELQLEQDLPQLGAAARSDLLKAQVHPDLRLEQELLSLEAIAHAEMLKAHEVPGSVSGDSTEDLGSEVSSLEELPTERTDSFLAAPAAVMLACAPEPCQISSMAEEVQEEEDWVIEQILSTKWHEGEAHFQVKWCGHPARTWETEESLFHEDYVSQLLAFQGAEAARRRAEAERRRETSRKAWQEKLQKLQQAEARREAALQSRRARQFLSRAMEVDRRLTSMPLFNPCAFWPNCFELIAKRFEQARCVVLQVENVCNLQQGTAFDSWLQGGIPEMLFHGTSAHNLHGIIENGLQVPGTFDGVRVANGSAYGVGIYTASVPQVGYARGFDYHSEGISQMFCCAGVCSGRTRQVGGYTIFFNASLVLPCFLVTFKACYGSARQPPASARYPYQPRLVSEVPVKLDGAEGSVVCFPRSGLCLPVGQTPARPLNSFVSVQSVASASGVKLLRKRVLYIAKGDHEGHVRDTSEVPHSRAWYDREHKTLSRRQLRAMPRSAKSPFRRGLVAEPKRDRTRGREERLRARRRSTCLAEEELARH